MSRITSRILMLALGASAAGFAAEPASDIWQAVTEGTTKVDAKYRFEYVDQDGFDKDAVASNIDLTLSYQTMSYEDFSGLIEFELVAPVGNGDLFNSTSNGITNRPVVADPDDVYLNRLFLEYAPEALAEYSFTGKLGRQWLNFDNQRHVGTVGWRLNDQVYDALTVSAKPVEEASVTAAYVTKVHRVNGTRTDYEFAGLFNASYEFAGYGKASVYAYMLDIEDSLADIATYGARFAGAYAIDDTTKVLYEVEFAQQGDFADATADYSATYMHLLAGVKYDAYSASIGYEVAGSDDGTRGFAFPLGTNHKFGGWVDKFLATPADGLIDLYIKLTADISAVPGMKAALFYHMFEGDDSGNDFGDEIDAVLTWKYSDKVSFGAKLGMYSADTFATDTTKAWLWTQVSF